MSCNNSSEFSNIKNTWTRKSSLNMTGWDPYPELQGPDCFGNRCQDMRMNKESFCCGGVYPQSSSTWNRSDIGPHNTYAQAIQASENYIPCCATFGYSQLMKTWKDQKDYTL